MMYVYVLYNIINFYMQSRMLKEWLSLFQLPLLCHGLIDHSNRTHQLTWFLPTIKQNPNLTISVLYKHLYDCFKAGKVWAPTLYLQADNCYKENKNKHMLFFAACLIKWGWFDEVYLSYLLTGHTHEDIDCLFSYLKLILRHDEYNTLKTLIDKLIPRAYLSRVKPISSIHLASLT